MFACEYDSPVVECETLLTEFFGIALQAVGNECIPSVIIVFDRRLSGVH
jgi:hypothetical protein